jgi:hypothetical protein
MKCVHQQVQAKENLCQHEYHILIHFVLLTLKGLSGGVARPAYTMDTVVS